MRRSRSNENQQAKSEEENSTGGSSNSLTPSDASSVAAEALSAFQRHSCPQYIKAEESSVFAAFVMKTESAAAASSAAFHAISFGIGTHAVGVGAPRDEADTALCLRDMHAEVLARRGLIAFLLSCCGGGGGGGGSPNPTKGSSKATAATVAPTTPPLVNPMQKIAETKQWALKPGVSFHLFISQTPCGDASVFPGAAHGARCFRLTSSNAEQEQQPAAYEEKLELQPHHDQRKDQQQQQQQQLFVSKHHNGVDDDVELRTRLKPGRGFRSTSMSCSDKICKWAALGLQGAAAGTVLPRIELASVTVLCDPLQVENATAEQGQPHRFFRSPLSPGATLRRLERALVQRLASAAPESCGRPCTLPFKVAVIETSAALVRPFLHTSKSGGVTSPVCLVGHAALEQPASWEIRQLTGKDGAPQGSAAAGRKAVLSKATQASEIPSRVEMSVCRRGMLRSILRATVETGKELPAVCSYRALKQSNEQHRESKAAFHSAGSPFECWVHDSATSKHDVVLKV